MVLVFTERPDPTLSSVEVLDASGIDRGARRASIPPGHPDELALPLSGIGDGVYTVAWRTVSASDGHAATGAFSFGVNASPVGALLPAALVAPARASGQAVLARWVYYLGVMGLLGIVFVALAVFWPPPEKFLRWGLCMTWLTAVAGTVGIAVAQASSDGVGLGRLLSSSVGHASVARVVPLLVAGLGIGAALALRARPRRIALVIVGASTAVAMLADVHASHAAAARSWTWLHVLLLWGHFLAVGVWIGGLAALLACLPGMGPARRATGLRRYSATAAVALFAVAGSGAVQAVAEVGTWRALVSTGFGQLVMVKVAVIVLLGALGAVNRYRNVPRATHVTSALHRVALTELGLAVGALLATAVLQNLGPVSSAAAAIRSTEPKVSVAEGTDVSETTRAKVTIQPLYGGFDRFRVDLRDRDTGSPVTADEVSLRFVLPARADIGESDLVLTRAGAGVYRGQGGNVALAGAWTVTVVVQRSDGGLEIPLSVTTPGIPGMDPTMPMGS